MPIIFSRELTPNQREQMLLFTPTAIARTFISNTNFSLMEIYNVLCCRKREVYILLKFKFFSWCVKKDITNTDFLCCIYFTLKININWENMMCSCVLRHGIFLPEATYYWRSFTWVQVGQIHLFDHAKRTL
jgi:hypothetical protein